MQEHTKIHNSVGLIMQYIAHTKNNTHTCTPVPANEALQDHVERRTCSDL